MEALCRGSPEEFNKYIQYCRTLNFDEKPDYNYCRSLFKAMMTRNSYENDGLFDWIIKKEGKNATVPPQLTNPPKPQEYGD